MSDIAERYDRVATAFTERVEAVRDIDWEKATPCEGWVARDVVEHLTSWIPGFFSDRGVPVQAGPSPADGPLPAWEAIDSQIRAILADEARAGAEFQSPMGPMPLDVAIERFVMGDVLIHTWDLARAVGLDDNLDAEAVTLMREGMEPMADMLAQSGQFGRRVPVPDDAPEQDRLLGLLGRQP